MADIQSFPCTYGVMVDATTSEAMAGIVTAGVRLHR